jgi:hypothetical protein
MCPELFVRECIRARALTRDLGPHGHFILPIQGGLVEGVFLNPAREIGASKPKTATDPNVGKVPRTDQLVERAARDAKQLGGVLHFEERLGEDIETCSR